VSHVPEGHEATERDLNGLEQGADRNLIKFNKEKCKVLQQGRGSPMHWYMLVTTQLESGFAEKDVGVLVGTKLNMSQQCALAAKKGPPEVPSSLSHSVKSCRGWKSSKEKIAWKKFFILLDFMLYYSSIQTSTLITFFKKHPKSQVFLHCADSGKFLL